MLLRFMPWMRWMKMRCLYLTWRGRFSLEKSWSGSVIKQTSGVGSTWCKGVPSMGAKWWSSEKDLGPTDKLVVITAWENDEQAEM